MQSTSVVKQSHKRSPLQTLKDNWRGYMTSNNNFLPTSMEEVNQLHNRQLAINFLNSKMNNHSSSYTKTQFCKEHRVSHNTLNKGLEILGVKTKQKQRSSKSDVNLQNQRPNKTVQDNSRQKKKRDVSAGGVNQEYVNSFVPPLQEDTWSINIPTKSGFDSHDELNASSTKLLGHSADFYRNQSKQQLSQNSAR